MATRASVEQVVVQLSTNFTVSIAVISTSSDRSGPICQERFRKRA
jgi:hypothetical protein